MVNSLFDPVSGKSMINQYGSVDTQIQLGQMDTVVDGTDAVLQFHPIKAEKNNYNVITMSYNLDELGVTTSLTAIGKTTIGESTSPPSPLVAIGVSNVIGVGGSEVKICTVGTASTTGTALTSIPGVAGVGTEKYDLYNPRSAKIIVSIATSEGSVEYDELSLIVGTGMTSLEWHEYGQLAIHNRRDNLAAQPLGTFRPYIVGVGTTAAVEVGYTPNTGIGTAWINSITIGISSETFTGIGTYDLRNASMVAKSTTIAAASSPATVGIASYVNDYDGAYCIVQIVDETNDIYEFAEVMMVDDDNRVFITEYGNLRTGLGATDSLGTIGGSRDTDGCRSELTFTPKANVGVKIKTFINALRVEENSAKPELIELNSGSIRSSFDVYEGTFYGARTEFECLHNGNEIFRKNFDASSTDVVNLTNNTIDLPNHYFVSGEEVVYSVKAPITGCSTTGIGTTGDAIGIAATYFAGVGATITYMPESVFVYKKSDSQIQLCRSAEDALVTPVKPIDLTSVGIGTSHSITAKYGTENVRSVSYTHLPSPRDS